MLFFDTFYCHCLLVADVVTAQVTGLFVRFTVLSGPPCVLWRVFDTVSK